MPKANVISLRTSLPLEHLITARIFVVAKCPTCHAKLSKLSPDPQRSLVVVAMVHTTAMGSANELPILSLALTVGDADKLVTLLKQSLTGVKNCHSGDLQRWIHLEGYARLCGYKT